MTLMVNGEAWTLHVRHANAGHTNRFTQAWLHRGGCVLKPNGLMAGRAECTSGSAATPGMFNFPARVLRRRAVFVHGQPAAVRDRWTMPFSRALGRREAFTRALARMFPTRGLGDDKTARAAFWAAYFAALSASKINSAPQRVKEA